MATLNRLVSRYLGRRTLGLKDTWILTSRNCVYERQGKRAEWLCSRFPCLLYVKFGGIEIEISFGLSISPSKCLYFFPENWKIFRKYYGVSSERRAQLRFLGESLHTKKNRDCIVSFNFSLYRFSLSLTNFGIRLD